MFKDEILENERRRKIFALIETSPGVHLRELQRMLDMPLTTLEYHLTYMTRKKIVLAETEDHHKRYYTKPLDPEDKKVLSALRQRRMREIVLTVLSCEKAKYQLLADCLKLSHSCLSSYLKYLVGKNILAVEKIGYENIYTVRDEDRVAKVLIAYKPSFLDKLVDRTLDTWMETHPHRKETLQEQDIRPSDKTGTQTRAKALIGVERKSLKLEVKNSRQELFSMRMHALSFCS